MGAHVHRHAGALESEEYTGTHESTLAMQHREHRYTWSTEQCRTGEHILKETHHTVTPEGIAGAHAHKHTGVQIRRCTRAWAERRNSRRMQTQRGNKMDAAAWR